MENKKMRPGLLITFAGALLAYLIGSGTASGQESVQYFSSWGSVGGTITVAVVNFVVIDAFLKKRYFGAPVAIKIQRSTESFGEAINLLYSAAKKKGCCFTVLISNSIRDNSIIIPENMIIIDRFNVKIEAEIQKRLSI